MILNEKQVTWPLTVNYDSNPFMSIRDRHLTSLKTFHKKFNKATCVRVKILIPEKLNWLTARFPPQQELLIKHENGNKSFNVDLKATRDNY